jgi:hypothetical protein
VTPETLAPAINILATPETLVLVIDIQASLVKRVRETNTLS